MMTAPGLLTRSDRIHTLEYWHYCRHRFGFGISVVAGFDANVTLPRNVPQTTGPATLRPLKSHSAAMQERIVGWMQLLGLCALNTCGQTLADSELWTCGIKRSSANRSQIDFLAASCDLHACAAPINMLDL